MHPVAPPHKGPWSVRVEAQELVETVAWLVERVQAQNAALGKLDYLLEDGAHPLKLPLPAAPSFAPAAPLAELGADKTDSGLELEVQQAKDRLEQAIKAATDQGSDGDSGEASKAAQNLELIDAYTSSKVKELEKQIKEEVHAEINALQASLAPQFAQLQSNIANIARSTPHLPEGTITEEITSTVEDNRKSIQNLRQEVEGLQAAFRLPWQSQEAATASVGTAGDRLEEAAHPRMSASDGGSRLATFAGGASGGDAAGSEAVDMLVARPPTTKEVSFSAERLPRLEQLETQYQELAAALTDSLGLALSRPSSGPPPHGIASSLAPSQALRTESGQTQRQASHPASPSSKRGSKNVEKQVLSAATTNRPVSKPASKAGGSKPTSKPGSVPGTPTNGQVMSLVGEAPEEASAASPSQANLEREGSAHSGVGPTPVQGASARVPSSGTTPGPATGAPSIHARRSEGTSSTGEAPEEASASSPTQVMSLVGEAPDEASALSASQVQAVRAGYSQTAALERETSTQSGVVSTPVAGRVASSVPVGSTTPGPSVGTTGVHARRLEAIEARLGELASAIVFAPQTVQKVGGVSFAATAPAGAGFRAGGTDRRLDDAAFGDAFGGSVMSGSVVRPAASGVDTGGTANVHGPGDLGDAAAVAARSGLWSPSHPYGANPSAASHPTPTSSSHGLQVQSDRKGQRGAATTLPQAGVGSGRAKRASHGKDSGALSQAAAASANSSDAARGTLSSGDSLSGRALFEDWEASVSPKLVRTRTAVNDQMWDLEVKLTQRVYDLEERVRYLEGLLREDKIGSEDMPSEDTEATPATETQQGKSTVAEDPNQKEVAAEGPSQSIAPSSVSTKAPSGSRAASEVSDIPSLAAQVRQLHAEAEHGRIKMSKLQAEVQLLRHSAPGSPGTNRRDAKLLTIRETTPPPTAKQEEQEARQKEVQRAEAAAEDAKASAEVAARLKQELEDIVRAIEVPSTVLTSMDSVDYGAHDRSDMVSNNISVMSSFMEEDQTAAQKEDAEQVNAYMERQMHIENQLLQLEHKLDEQMKPSGGNSDEDGSKQRQQPESPQVLAGLKSIVRDVRQCLQRCELLIQLPEIKAFVRRFQRSLELNAILHERWLGPDGGAAAKNAILNTKDTEDGPQDAQKSGQSTPSAPATPSGREDRVLIGKQSDIARSAPELVTSARVRGRDPIGREVHMPSSRRKGGETKKKPFRTVVDWCRPHTPLSVEPVFKGHSPTRLGSRLNRDTDEDDRVQLPQIGGRLP